ncbi:hypothetical protein D5086_001701 [Populus alba]|uniref:Uncharacterized protein n=1 Tax=Populus alba TaxID=43335 RepID=A0ACC4CZE2_POPAL
MLETRPKPRRLSPRGASIVQFLRMDLGHDFYPIGLALWSGTRQSNAFIYIRGQASGLTQRDGPKLCSRT